MRILVVLIALLLLPFPSFAQSILPETKIDHAWVEGVYWNSSQLPGWGFFVDVQEESMFGAIYGYLGQDSTFITLQGDLTSLDPLVFKGDVFFITGGGSVGSDVGDFTWNVRVFEANPSASLTITSNILNVSNLNLVRFSYVEVDKVDVITGGKWNIVRRVLDITFGDYYSIEDLRVDVDGETFAGVIDIVDTDKIGAVGYVPDGDVYGLMIPFTDTSNVFYMFNTSNTDMYGRYWLLDEGEIPSGNGNYFRGAVDNLQSSYSGGGIVKANSVSLQQGKIAASKREMRELELIDYKNSSSALESMFPDSVIQSTYKKLLLELENQHGQSHLN